MIEFEILGLMSGTSLDGLDIAHVKFVLSSEKKEFKLLNYKTFEYNSDFVTELRNAPTLSVIELLKLDKKIGKEFANNVNLFLKEFQIEKNNIQAIASHGQTILHQPQNGFTLQIGCGATIAYHTQLPVINDFRTMDVVAGGQGAPLVPIGDFELFASEAEAFMNLGGFANISLKKENTISAFDISPANLPLNELVKELGVNYDEEGKIARKGTINSELLSCLNSLAYYSMEAPKSLGTEWLEAFFNPVLQSFEISIEDKLATISEHIALQIAQVIEDNQLENVMTTGGGTKNTYLIDCIQFHTKNKLVFMDENISDFKEAIVFAYLGALFLLDQPNCVDSVTGAQRPVIGGCLHKASK
jgi:anhydro-N-acetylmuramic acid kinase